jgi:carbon storage regulator
MLILSRKIGEELVINDDIRIKVIDIQGGRVRLGFAAPPEVIIHREELYERIRQAPSQAAPPEHHNGNGFEPR